MLGTTPDLALDRLRRRRRRVVHRGSRFITSNRRGFPKHKSKLKPAFEDWWLAIKPCGRAVELNIDRCRIAGSEVGKPRDHEPRKDRENWRITGGSSGNGSTSPLGRYPPNLALSHSESCRIVGRHTIPGDPRPGGEGSRPGGFYATGSASGDGKSAGILYGDAEVDTWECSPDCPIAELDRQSGICKSGSRKAGDYKLIGGHGRYGEGEVVAMPEVVGDSGGASRFFPNFQYVAKASNVDRGDYNNHPTVKSTPLMQWLIRLITPPDSTIFDPFMGSGSTGKAAILEGFSFLGVEERGEDFRTARRRIREVYESAYPAPALRALSATEIDDI